MVFDTAINIHMWVTIALTVLAFFMFARERYPLEMSAVIILCALLLFGHFFPYADGGGRNLLSTERMLSGFSNPSLLAVMAFLVIGQALVRTSALSPLTDIFLRMKSKTAAMGLVAILFFVAAISAFMNNTPLVIIAIPLMQELAARLGLSSSRVMIPLSYCAILGGMVTLVGSSTNMLVSSALYDLGFGNLDFFQFTVPGLCLAGVGLVYVLLVLPRILEDRATIAGNLEREDKQFIAELDIFPDSKLVGKAIEEGMLSGVGEEISVRLARRGHELILPPFEGYAVGSSDVLIVSASREVLTRFLTVHKGFFLSSGDSVLPQAGESSGKIEPHILAEVMIPPASRLIDITLEQAGFEQNYDCRVLGIERRSRVVRRRLGQIRPEAGDVLLVLGRMGAINNLRNFQDVILLSGSKRDVPLTERAPHAALIFLATTVLAASNALSVPVAAITGAVAMVFSGCLSMRQAVRALDRKVFFLVGAALALGSALQSTGGAIFLADILLTLPIIQDPFMAAALLFIVVATVTNMLTNNACAILFTPVAVNLAQEIGADPIVFAITVIFAANCSFASPIGYQTNLLVMGPGHYQFKDFIRGGVPLVLIMWLTYCGLAKFYFGL